MQTSRARIAIVVLVIGAIVAAVFLTGWADDKAEPGSTGRGPVTAPASSDSP
jgi:hypothetical protein